MEHLLLTVHQFLSDIADGIEYPAEVSVGLDIIGITLVAEWEERKLVEYISIDYIRRHPEALYVQRFVNAANAVFAADI